MPIIREEDLPVILSHFRLDKILGAGGMGAVYKGIDRRDETPVAIKVMHAHLASDRSFRERFEREAHVAALLRSPYTVHLLDYGIEGDSYYMAMEYINGPTVKDVIAEGGPLPLDRALRIAIQIARALEEAQARGVVHRDIKPENVMLAAEDSAKVTDFGISKLVGNAQLTMPGAFVGTLSFSAPEQLLGHADFRSDVYALGASLFNMLTGHPVYSGTISEISEKIRHAPIPIEDLEGTPRGVVYIVRKCLEKDAARRYQTASELAAALEHATQNPDYVPEEALDKTVVDADLTAATIVDTTGPATIGTGKPSGGTVASTPALSARLDEVSPGGRFGKARYRLSLTNHTQALLSVQLSSAGQGCAFDHPERVDVGAGGLQEVSVRIGPESKRLFGSRESRPFTISASGGGGGPPLTLNGQFDDQPFGFMPFGLGLAAVALPVAVIAVVLAGSGGDGSTPGDGGDDDGSGGTPTEAVIDVPSPTGAPLNIGVLVPLSGNLQAQGEEHRNAATLAAEEINAAGGVRGRPLTIIEADSEGDAATGVTAAQSLVDQGAQVIIGDLTSNVTAPVAEQVSGPLQVLTISPSALSPSLTTANDSDFLFRSTLSDAAEGAVLAQLAREAGFSSVCSLYLDEPYGQGMNEVFGDFGSDVERMEVPVLRNQDTYAPQLDACEGTQALVIMSFFQTGGQLLVQEALDRGFTEFLFADGMRSESVFAERGWDSFDGMSGADMGVSHLIANDDFDQAYEERFGAAPTAPFLRETYDAVYMAALAAEAADANASIAIRDSLRAVANAPGQAARPGTQGFIQAKEAIGAGGDVDYRGLSGSIELDAQGDITSGPVEVWRVNAAAEEIASESVVIVDFTTRTITDAQ